MRIVTLGVLLLLSSGIATAADKSAAPPAAQAAGPRGPCAADIDRFCSAVPFGNARRIACLEKHMPQLTPACRERVPKLRVLFEFGKKQQKLTEEYLAKQRAAEAKKSTPAAQPAPK